MPAIDSNCETLKVFVISDLHAFDAKKGKYKTDDTPSFLDISQPDIVSRNPLLSLNKFVKENSLKADLMICCGDMGDKAYPAALKYAWTHINSLKDSLGVQRFVATVGNHDVDSRYVYNQFDAKGHVQSLDPAFPDPDESHNNRFWAQHFTIYEQADFRLVLLNSSAYHGYKDEFKHGRIAETTLARLKTKLAETKEAPINILVCHHHPRKHAEAGVDDYSAMENGQGLLDLLGSGDFGQWVPALGMAINEGHADYPKPPQNRGFNDFSNPLDV
jgi:predicted MPP superfamily phosphohydrolase